MISKPAKNLSEEDSKLTISLQTLMPELFEETDIKAPQAHS